MASDENINIQLKKYRTAKRRLFRTKFVLVLLVIALPFLYYSIPWNCRVPSPQQALPSPNVSPYCFSAARNAGLALLGGNQDDAWLVEPSTGKVLQRFSTPFRKTSSVDLTPDGKTAAVCEADGTLSLWNTQDGSKISAYSAYVPIDDPDVNDASIDRYRIALSPDASTVLVSDKLMGLRLLESRREKELRTLIGDNRGEHGWFDFSPQGDAVYVFNVKTSSLEIHSLIDGASQAVKVEPISLQTALNSPDGDRLFLAGKDGLIRVWDVASQKVVKLLRHPYPITALSVSTDGSLLFAGGEYGVVSVWNLPRLQYVRTVYDGEKDIFAIWIAPDRTEFVAVERTGAMWNWNFESGRCDWRMDGFKLNAQNQVVSGPQSAPKPVDETNPLSNDDFQALLDRPINDSVVFKDEFIPRVLDFLQERIHLKIKLNIVRTTNYRPSEFFSYADWLTEAISENSLDYLIQKNGTIRIGRPETLDRYRESASDKSLYDIPELNVKAPDIARYVYVEDIVRTFRSTSNVNAVVEDDLYGKVTLDLDAPTPRQILEIALFPNGLDYSVNNGALNIGKKDAAIDCLKTIVRSDPAIKSSLDIMSGFTPKQWDEMERRPDLRLTPDELSALIVNYHSQFDTTRIRYTGEERSGKPVGDVNGLPQQNWVDTVKQVLQLREDGTARFVDRIQSRDMAITVKKLESIPDERLEAFVRRKDLLRAGLVRQATRAYSASLRNRVQEVFMPEDAPRYHAFFLDEENSGWLYAPRSEKPEENYFIARSNKRPDHASRFGADLDWQLLNGYRIAELDWQNRKLRLVFHDPAISSYVYSRPQSYEYTLLDGHNAYWKQCDAIVDGCVIRRIVCSDFVEISGLMVPQTVTVWDYDGTEFVVFVPLIYDMLNAAPDSQHIAFRDGLSIGRYRYEYKMSLIDAKINEPIDKYEVDFKPPKQNK